MTDVMSSVGRSGFEASNGSHRLVSLATRFDLTILTMTLKWTEEQEEILQGPYLYLRSVPGKDLRSHLISAFNSVLQVDEHRLKIISDVVSMLHTASLIIDDVEDNAAYRRERPVAHSIFGAPQTINCSNYMIFLALKELQNLELPNALEIFSEEMIHLHRGQGLDLYWRETLTCPTEDEYITMALNKTGGLYRLATRLMQEASSNKDVDLVTFANHLGIVYQIQDDFLNLQSLEYTKNKGFCEDLTEGKFSFPIIHAIRADPANKELLNILKQRTSDDSLKKYAVDYMRRKNSFAYCMDKRDEYHNKCMDELNHLNTLGYNTSMLRKVLDKMLSLD